MRVLKILAWVGGGVVLFSLLFFLCVYLAQEPLRRFVVTRMNEQLKGYSVKVGAVILQPIGLSITLKDFKVIQDAHPDPPVADVPYFNASVNWRGLIHGRLVGDLLIDNPRVHVNLSQLREEASKEAPVDDRGWQDAVLAIYPLEINEITLTNGHFVYIDQDPERPIRLGSINFSAGNIRNVRSEKRTYPSPVSMEATLFGSGRGKIVGVADFLSEPYPGVNARLDVNDAPLDYLRPILMRYNIFLNGGTVSAHGSVEFSPKTTQYRFETVDINGVKLDYTIQESPKKVAAKAEEAAETDESNLFQIDKLNVSGDMALVNTTTNPHYRVFLEKAELRLRDLSTGFRDKEAKAELTGLFMGSGKTTATATFRSEEKGPDFDMNLKIEETRAPSMNDLLRAYGNFDVVGGTFSMFSEIRVKNEKINGYVKPLFEDLDVYDRRQDEEKNLFRKMYEGLVGGVSGLLENEPKEQVATKADISGNIENPQTSTWQTVANLIRNAFFRAILPEFEKGVTG